MYFCFCLFFSNGTFYFATAVCCCCYYYGGMFELTFRAHINIHGKYKWGVEGHLTVMLAWGGGGSDGGCGPLTATH